MQSVIPSLSGSENFRWMFDKPGKTEDASEDRSVNPLVKQIEARGGACLVRKSGGDGGRVLLMGCRYRGEV